MLSVINKEPSDKEGRGTTYYLQVLTNNISICISDGEYHDFKENDIIKVIYLYSTVYLSFGEKSLYFFDQSTNALLTIDRFEKQSAKLTFTKLFILRYISDVTKSIEREEKLKILLS